jgi:uncharacterized membrane protein YebE (DUF533 family)
MSFVRTLATLAAGFAAAKGYDRFRQMGGMDGVRKALEQNPAIANNPAARQMLDMLGGAATQGGQAASAGMAQLMAAVGGAAAGGAAQTAAMLDGLTGTTQATGAMEENARLMIRAMIMAAKADGVIDARERALIEEHLGEATPEERAFVAAEMERPVDVLALAGDVQGAARGQVYSAAAGVCRGDSPAEAQFLAALGGALQLDHATRTMIHASLGIPAPAA